MVGTSLRDRVHQILGQDTAASTNLVGATAILDFLNEGIDVACSYGHIWECKGTITMGAGTANYLYPTVDTLTSSTACKCVDIYDVQWNGASLNKVPLNLTGKLFSLSTTTLYWSAFGQNIFLYPTPTATETAITTSVYVLFWGKPTGSLVYSGPTGSDFIEPTFIPYDLHHLFVTWAAFRGKQVYQMHQEASTFLEAFARGVGLTVEELKDRAGL
jgi:hypothetical protein